MQSEKTRNTPASFSVRHSARLQRRPQPVCAARFLNRNSNHTLNGQIIKFSQPPCKPPSVSAWTGPSAAPGISPARVSENGLILGRGDKALLRVRPEMLPLLGALNPHSLPWGGRQPFTSKNCGARGWRWGGGVHGGVVWRDHQAGVGSPAGWAPATGPCVRLSCGESYQREFTDGQSCVYPRTRMEPEGGLGSSCSSASLEPEKPIINFSMQSPSMESDGGTAGRAGTGPWWRCPFCLRLFRKQTRAGCEGARCRRILLGRRALGRGVPPPGPWGRLVTLCSCFPGTRCSLSSVDVEEWWFGWLGVGGPELPGPPSAPTQVPPTPASYSRPADRQATAMQPGEMSNSSTCLRCPHPGTPAWVLRLFLALLSLVLTQTELAQEPRGHGQRVGVPDKVAETR